MIRKIRFYQFLFLAFSCQFAHGQPVQVTGDHAYVNGNVLEAGFNYNFYKQDTLYHSVQETKREERQVDLEAALVKKQQDIRRLSDSLLNEQHDRLARFQVKPVLLDFTQQIMTEYNTLGIAEKNAQIEPTLNCLYQVEKLIRNLENVPENSYMVQEAYTNKVFNPYTFTDMEEIVKEPIYNSFTKVLLPGVFSNLQHLSCENIWAYNKNFDTLFEGMLQALNRNTRKEERQIKRTNKAAKAAEILQINLTF